MKTTVTLLIGLAFVIYSSGPKINFKPFSISFESPYTPFAIFFLILSLSLFSIQSEKKGYRQGMQDLSNELVKELKEKKQD